MTINIHQSTDNGNSKLSYDQSARIWTVACNSSLTEFPASKQGKLQAQLYVLEQDRPDIFAEIQATKANRPDLTESGEIIRGGLILASGGVHLLHLNHYRVQSQGTPGKSYIVGIFPYTGFHCQCEHWLAGNMKHYYGFNRRVYPPWVDGVGPFCKHAAAVWLSQLISPIEPCWVCNGKAYTGFVTAQAGYQTIAPCETCHATGAQPAREFTNHADFEQAEIR